MKWIGLCIRSSHILLGKICRIVLRLLCEPVQRGLGGNVGWEDTRSNNTNIANRSGACGNNNPLWRARFLKQGLEGLKQQQRRRGINLETADQVLTLDNVERHRGRVGPSARNHHIDMVDASLLNLGQCFPGVVKRVTVDMDEKGLAAVGGGE